MKLQFSGIKVFLWLIACCLTLCTAAQQSHFMYIQSDNKAPFSVTVDNNTQYSSNGTGYLIVPKISKGKHQVNIGFADNKYPVQSFAVEITDSDMGYALKNYGEKGWGLFNLQTMGVIMAKSGAKPAPSEAPAPVASSEPETSGKPANTAGTGKNTTAKPAAAAQPTGNQFGDMLSQVVGDPTLQQKSPAVAPKPATVQTPAASQTQEKAPAATGKPSASPATAAAAVTKPASDSEATTTTEAPDDAWDAAATRGVIKTGEQAGKEGVGYTFIDFNAKGADTVKIFIPAPIDSDGTSVENAASGEVAPKEPGKPKKETAGNKANTDKKNDPVFFETPAATPATGTETAVSNPFYNKPADKTDKTGKSNADKTSSTAIDKKDTTPATVSEAGEEPSSGTKSVAAAAYNSNCTGGMAASKDLEKLKKKMVSEESDDKMVAAARKGFKSKCYTTEQIKELGRLFYTDESRYKFYDAAYPFVYDVTNFPSLEQMLLDDYYKKRFRAMLRL